MVFFHVELCNGRGSCSSISIIELDGDGDVDVESEEEEDVDVVGTFMRNCSMSNLGTS